MMTDYFTPPPVPDRNEQERQKRLKRIRQRRLRIERQRIRKSQNDWQNLGLAIIAFAVVLFQLIWFLIGKGILH